MVRYEAVQSDWFQYSQIILHPSLNQTLDVRTSPAFYQDEQGLRSVYYLQRLEYSKWSWHFSMLPCYLSDFLLLVNSQFLL